MLSTFFTHRTLTAFRFWIEKASAFNSPESPRTLRGFAQYEVAVARLQGFCSLLGHEMALAEYSDGFEDSTSLGELEDCVVLLSICLSAEMLGHANFDMAALAGWQARLVAHVESEPADGH